MTASELALLLIYTDLYYESEIGQRTSITQSVLAYCRKYNIDSLLIFSETSIGILKPHKSYMFLTRDKFGDWYEEIEEEILDGINDIRNKEWDGLEYINYFY